MRVRVDLGRWGEYVEVPKGSRDVGVGLESL